MTARRWIGRDGWPVDYPPALTDAIRRIPGCKCDETEIAALAACLAEAEAVGWQAELPNSVSKSFSANEAAIRATALLCERLSDQLHDLPCETCSAMLAEGFDVAAFKYQVGAAREAAIHAFGALTAPSRVAGREAEHRARIVADEAASVFEAVAGRGPTFTTNPLKKEAPRRLGPWPEFLGCVFSALMIDGSTDAHVERIAKSRKALKNG